MYKEICIAVTLCFVAAFIPSGLYAQISGNPMSGNVRAPQLCPSKPYLIAFEQRQGDVQNLYIYDARNGSATRVSASQQTGGDDPFGDLFNNTDTADLQRFEGQLSWRPGLDGEGRHWFAYIASSTGGLDLFLSYVDEDGRLAPEPLQIALPRQQFHPAWSASGEHLAFMSGEGGRSNLQYITTMSDLLLLEEATAFNPLPLTQGGNMKFAPAWSPDEQSIAFEMVNFENGVTNRGIYLVYLQDGLNNPVLNPVALTSSLNNYDESQPSWSSNGEFVAYYVTQAQLDEASDNQLQDIGILNVVRSGTQGRIVQGNILSGLSPRLAENVIPNAYGGPQWVGEASNTLYPLHKTRRPGRFPNLPGRPGTLATAESWL